MFTKADLLKRRPDHAPTLNAKGKVARALLEFCDGGHTVEGILAEVVNREPEALGSDTALRKLVTDLLDEWAE